MKKTILKVSLMASCIGLVSAGVISTTTSCSSSNNKALLVGHRGAPTIKFENTYDSYIEAGKDSNYSAIECDVYPVKDTGINQFYCVHDNTPFRDSDDKNKTFSEQTSDFIEDHALSLSAGYPRDIEPADFAHDYKHTDYHACNFVNYLNVCKRYHKTSVIEIKDSVKWTEQDHGIWTDEALTNMIKFVKDIMGDNYIFISFDNPLLKYINEKFDVSKKNIQQLYDPSLTDEWKDWKYIADNGWNIDVGDIDSPSTQDWGIKIDKEFVNYFHSRGLKVNVWTVNTLDRADALNKMGVDYLTSDYDLYL